LLGDGLDGVADALDDLVPPTRHFGPGEVASLGAASKAVMTCEDAWWGVSGLNRRPTDYEAAWQTSQVPVAVELVRGWLALACPSEG
jgi:hypothetical protein